MYFASKPTKICQCKIAAAANKCEGMRDPEKKKLQCGNYFARFVFIKRALSRKRIPQ
jgi:hypothetical protein